MPWETVGSAPPAVSDLPRSYVTSAEGRKARQVASMRGGQIMDSFRISRDRDDLRDALSLFGCFLLAALIIVVAGI